MTLHGLLTSAAEAYRLSPGEIAPELGSASAAGVPRVDVDWLSIDPHAVGEMHRDSVLAASPLSRKARGAYYTPRPVARLLAEGAIPLVQPAGRELPKILDPACGCGSLLVEAMRYLCGHLGASPLEAVSCLRGFDRDLDCVVLARVALIAAAYGLGARDVELEAAARRLSHRILVRDVLAAGCDASADCIVMNPPYVRAATSAAGRSQLRGRFRTATGVFDLHVPFIELALRSVRPGGSLGLLTTDKFLVADYGRKLRAHLAKEVALVRLLMLGECVDVRPGALVAQTVVTAVRQRPSPRHVVEVLRPHGLADLDGGRAGGVRLRQRELLATRWPLLRAGPAERRVVWRMTSGDVTPLGSMVLVRGGVRGFDYQACCEHLVEGQGHADEMPVACPGNIRAYRRSPGRPVRLAGRKWKAPCLGRRPDRVPPRLWDLFGRPKLLVKGVGPRPTAALSRDPAALFVAVWGVWGPDDLLGSLLGLLNSKPAAWLHFQQLYTARIPRGSLRVPMSWLAAFPVPRGDLSELRHLALRRVAATTDTERDRLQDQIDRAAARAYGLGEDELRLMEGVPLRAVQT